MGYYRVDANLNQPEARRVTFYTSTNRIFCLDMAVDNIQFIKMVNFEVPAPPDPNALMAQVHNNELSAPGPAHNSSADDDTDEFLKSLGM